MDQPTEMPAGETTQAIVETRLREQVGDVAKYIEVTVEGGTVTLGGAVESWAERDAVLQAAQTTPGVERVVNHTHLRGYRIAW